MCQTDRIHECFYDLFNQRFRTIPYVEGKTQYYVNIALGAFAKLCRVDPQFQCIILLKKSELKQAPAPFLNRFEKYSITHESLLNIVMNYNLPPCLKIVVSTVYTEVSYHVVYFTIGLWTDRTTSCTQWHILSHNLTLYACHPFYVMRLQLCDS